MEISQIITAVKNLPPSPEILPRLQTLVKDPDSKMDDIIDLISFDSSLTAQVIRISNSAFYSGSTPVASLEEAVNRIGLYEVYKLVSFVVTSQLFSSNMPVYKTSARSMWQNSVISGCICKHISCHFTLDPDTSYLTGLLHSIGKIVINAYYIEKGIEVYSDQDDSITPEQEEALLGFNNSQVGAELLRMWKFREEVIEIIAKQYSPPQNISEIEEHLILSCSKVITPIFSSATNLSEEEKENLHQTLLDEYHFAPPELEKILQRIESELQAMQELFSVM